MSDPFGALPRRYFGAIYADPPWLFKTWSARGEGRSPKYLTQNIDWLKSLPVYELAKDNCALFLWTTSPMLSLAFGVMRSWDFSYKTIAFTWVKKGPIGMGYWTRSGSEICLLATRGKPRRRNADVRQVIYAPRREHSRKPNVVPGRIERLVAGPYVELFARERRTGWHSWGNEVEKFATVAAAGGGAYGDRPGRGISDG